MDCASKGSILCYYHCQIMLKIMLVFGKLPVGYLLPLRMTLVKLWGLGMEGKPSHPFDSATIRFASFPKVVLFFADRISEDEYKGQYFFLIKWSTEDNSKWRVSSCLNIRWSTALWLVFLSFRFILSTRKANLQKNTQIKRKGFQSLEINDENSPNDRYGKNLSPCLSSFNSCRCMYVSTLFIEGDDSQLKTEKLAAIKLTSTQG